MKHKDRFVFGRTARSVLRTMLSVVLLLCSILFLPGVTADVSAQTLTADTNKIVTSTANVTINSVPEGKSITWATYQVLYANYDAGSNALEYHLTDWARDVLVGTGTTGTGTTEEAAIKKITELMTTGTVATEQSELVNRLAAATKIPYTAASWRVTGTDAAADLPVGAYLVIPSCEGMTFLNMLVSVDTSGTTDTADNGWVLTAKGAVLKGKTLSIDKKITGKNGSTPVVISAGKTTETAQIGDTIHYTIEAQVPHYPDNSTGKIFRVVDTPTNLSISTESISVAGVDADGGETPIAAASYDVSKDSANGPVTIDFSDSYNGTFYNTTEKSWPYVSVKITYTAVVTEAAKIGTEGNPNTAKLIYRIDTQEKELPSPKTTVFTYGLNVVKLEARTEAGTEAKKLTNAVFQISRDVNETPTPLYFKDNADGSYTLAQDQTTAASTTGYTKDLKTQGTDGSFLLKGLDARVDYSLKEVKAPSGYSVNTDTLTIRLTAKTNPDDSTYTGILQEVTGTEKDKNDQVIATDAGSWKCGLLDADKAKAAVSLTDTKLFELPATGGKGTDGFARNGILLLTAAVLVYGISRRKKQDERG